MAQTLGPTLTNHSITQTIRKVAPWLNLQHGPWVAGGSARKLAENQSLGSSDIDIFFRDQDSYDWAKNIIEKGARGVWSRRYSLVRTYDQPKSFRFDLRVQYENDLDTTVQVQLIKKQFYKNVDELFDDFDFTICMFATDGHEIVCEERSVRDLKARKLVMHKPPVKPKPARLGKYCGQGFTPEPGVIRTMLGVDLPRFEPKPGLYFDEY